MVAQTGILLAQDVARQCSVKWLRKQSITTKATFRRNVWIYLNDFRNPAVNPIIRPAEAFFAEDPECGKKEYLLIPH